MYGVTVKRRSGGTKKYFNLPDGIELVYLFQRVGQGQRMYIYYDFVYWI